MSIINLIKNYGNNCFWLFVPVFVFNIVLTKFLPEQYLKNVNHPIVIIETIIRIITIVFSVIMAAKPDNIIGKTGLIIYIAGVLIYFCSYFIVINIPAVSFHNNIIILLSPYWTAGLWLLGIGLLGNKLFVSIPYHYSVYIIISIIFTVIHSIHGYICFKN